MEILNEKQKPLIANEDMICYVKVKRRINIKNRFDIKTLHGKPFIGKINNVNCFGVIKVDNNDVLFYTNTDCKASHFIDNYLGYNYGYCLNLLVSSIIVDDEEILEIIYIDNLGKQVVLGEINTFDYYLFDKDGYMTKGISAFTNLDEAKLLSGIIVECLIPKGSIYCLCKKEVNRYKGDTHTIITYSAYISNKIKYGDIIYKRIKK